MSDEQIRQGNRLVDRLRAGLVVPAYTTAREVACAVEHCACGAEGGYSSNCSCPIMGATAFDALDLVRLRAFCGDEEAREIVGDEEASKWGVYDTADLDLWTGMLTRLAAKLPPARVEVWVENLDCQVPCGGCGQTVRPHCLCNPPPVHHDTPAETYLRTVATEAVGRACWRKVFRGPSGQMRPSPQSRTKAALDACAAWIADPTPERRTVWARADVGGGPGWLPDPPREASRGRLPGDPTRSLRSGTEVIGEPRVREIAAAAILEVL